MICPKTQSAKAIDDHVFAIRFGNDQGKQYDITPLLEREIFAPLKNQVLFRAVEVDQGGYAIVWNSTIDIIEHELWSNGQTMP